MKIKVIKSAMTSGLKKVQDAIPSKPTLAILSNVKIRGEGKKMSLTATNLDMTIHAEVRCEADGDGVMETTAPGRLLNSIVSALPDGVIELEYDGDVLRVRGGDSLFRIPCMDAKAYPVQKVIEGKKTYTIPAVTLKEIIRKTEFAQCTDTTRKTLESILFDFADNALTAVATDGRRLAKLTWEMADDVEVAPGQYVIPSSCIAVLGKALPSEGDVEIKAEDGHISFWIQHAAMSIQSKLVDDIYPNYRQVIPDKTSNEIEVDRLALMSAVTRCSLMGDDMNGKYVRFSIADNQMVVTVKNEATGGEARDVVPVKYEGEKLNVMFDPKYVMDPLKAIDADEITLAMNEAASPKVITVKGLPYLCVVMPIRTN